MGYAYVSVDKPPLFELIIDVSMGQAAVNLKERLFAVIEGGCGDVKVRVNIGDRSFAYNVIRGEAQHV
jgi:hypothetical protein